MRMGPGNTMRYRRKDQNKRNNHFPISPGLNNLIILNPIYYGKH
jgi:hypothetical protein